MRRLVVMTLGAIVVLTAETRADITDFSVFANGNTSLGLNSDIFSGIVGAGGNVVLSNGAFLADGASAGGNISGGSGTFSGAFTANGNATFGNNSDFSAATVIVGGTFSKGSGSAPASVLQGQALPVASLPALPSANVFSSGGADHIFGNNQALNLSPGSYGAVSFGNNGDLSLSAGTYMLDSLSMGSGADVFLDLSGGDIVLQITGNSVFGNNLEWTLSGGNASNILLETHGNFDVGNGGEFFGTIFAPTGNIVVGGNWDLTGAAYAGGNYSQGNGGSVNLLAGGHLDPPVQPIPAPGACLLGALGLGLVTRLRRRCR